MSSLQNIIKQLITVCVVTVSICAVAIVIELGIFISDWMHAEHNFNLSLPWSHHKQTNIVEGSLTAYAGVTDVVLNCGNYDVTISQSKNVKDVSVSYERNVGRVSVKQDGTTLYINQKRSYHLYELLEKKEKKYVTPGVISISIPANTSLSSVSLKMGNGTATLHPCSVDSLTIVNDSGILHANGIYAKETDLQANSGKMTLSDVNFEVLAMKSKYGDVYFSGNVNNSANLEVGTGEASFLFYSPRSYYDLQLKKGKGNIKIDGEDYENVPLSSEGTHSIALKNGSGNCTLSFQEP
ncbi:MAG: DUF4097 family beta strand repeat protein [Lachnospiraceae bacterium]|nr:DUF4097 family beta strand repeat protein [Lachnospiraceae bacterium]